MSDSGRNKKPSYRRIALLALTVLVVGYFIFVAVNLLKVV